MGRFTRESNPSLNHVLTFLVQMIPATLKIAIQEDEELRKSLPWNYIGTCHGNEVSTNNYTHLLTVPLE